MHWSVTATFVSVMCEVVLNWRRARAGHRPVRRYAGDRDQVTRAGRDAADQEADHRAVVEGQRCRLNDSGCAARAGDDPIDRIDLLAARQCELHPDGSGIVGIGEARLRGLRVSARRRTTGLSPKSRRPHRWRRAAKRSASNERWISLTSPESAGCCKWDRCRIARDVCYGNEQSICKAREPSGVLRTDRRGRRLIFRMKHPIFRMSRRAQTWCAPRRKREAEVPAFPESEWSLPRIGGGLWSNGRVRLTFRPAFPGRNGGCTMGPNALHTHRTLGGMQSKGNYGSRSDA